MIYRLNVKPQELNTNSTYLLSSQEVMTLYGVNVYIAYHCANITMASSDMNLFLFAH